MKTPFAITNNTRVWTHVHIMYQASLLDISSRFSIDPGKIEFYDVKSSSFKRRIIFGLLVNSFYGIRRLNPQVIEDIVRPCHALYCRKVARKHNSFMHRAYCFLKLLKDLILSFSLYAYCCRHEAFFQLGFSDHGCYSSSGAIEAACVALYKPFYNTAYPYSLNVVRPYPNSTVTTFRKISLPVPLSSINNDSDSDFNIPYLTSNFNSLQGADPGILSNLTKTEFVVYAHSFSDAQNYFGYDRVFPDIYHWTKFTLEYLLNKNHLVTLKAHPNFFADFASDIIDYDKRMFGQLMSTFSSCRNLLVINEPISNAEFLNLLPNSVNCLTHHGTVASEILAYPFKTICSAIHPLHEYFNHSENYFSWKSLKDYKYLMDFLPSKPRETRGYFPNLMKHFYSWKGSYASSFSSSYQIATFFGLNFSDYIKKPHTLIDNSYKSLSGPEQAMLHRNIQSTIIENPNNQFS